jgi:hypothetical protein
LDELAAEWLHRHELQGRHDAASQAQGAKSPRGRCRTFFLRKKVYFFLLIFIKIHFFYFNFKIG